LAKKAGRAARFGPRYGTKVRKLVLELQERARGPHKCPSCGALKVKRVSSSIWRCGRCGVKFASGAYVPAPAAVPETKGAEGGG